MGLMREGLLRGSRVILGDGRAADLLQRNWVVAVITVKSGVEICVFKNTTEIPPYIYYCIREIKGVHLLRI